MRLTTPGLIYLVALLGIALAQVCDSGTACGYYGTLCCTDDEICMTNADNQAVCEVPAFASSTPVVSSDLGTMMPTMVVSTDAASVTPIPTPTPTQVTGVETSSSKTMVVDATGTSLLSSSTAQSADTSVASSSASTTGAEQTVSTGSADASDTPALTTTTSTSGRVERSWYGVLGVGVVVAMVLMV